MNKVHDSLYEYSKKEDVLSKVLTIAVFCMAFIFLLSLVKNIFFINVIVDGESMENTLHDEDIVMLSKYSEIDYGDVIVIKGENLQGNWIIKRVIGLEGDTVKLEGGYVYLKKEGQTEYKKLEEPYIKEQGRTYWYDKYGYPILEGYKEYKVESGQIFYLGDNRENSMDSRSKYFTCGKEQVVGVMPDWSLNLRGYNAFMNKTFSFLKGTTKEGS